MRTRSAVSRLFRSGIAGLLAFGCPASETPPAAPAGGPTPGPSRSASWIPGAALRYARQIEHADPDQARWIYEDLVAEEYESDCSGIGPVGISCGDEAESRLRVLACRQARAGSEPVRRDDVVLLATEVVQAAQAADPTRLQALADCSFRLGPCHSDTYFEDEPGPAMRLLVRHADLVAEAGTVESWGPDRASVPTGPEPGLRLQFDRDPGFGGWAWAGTCYDHEIGARLGAK